MSAGVGHSSASACAALDAWQPDAAERSGRDLVAAAQLLPEGQRCVSWTNLRPPNEPREGALLTDLGPLEAERTYQTTSEAAIPWRASR